jgi:transcription elongation factor Elf1
VRKLTYEYVKDYIESKGCKLLESKYVDARTKMMLIGLCGHEFSVNFDAFKGKKQYICPECGREISSNKRKISYEEVLKYIEDNGCTLLFNNYEDFDSNLEILFSCGHRGNKSFRKFKSSKPICSKCSGNEKYTLEKIKEKLLKYGFVLDDNQEYINANTKIDFHDGEGYRYSFSMHCLDSAYKREFKVGRTFEKRNKYALENMKLWLKKNNKKFSFTCEEYKGSHCSNIVFECEICNHKWITAWSNIYSSNTGCPNCGRESSANKNSERNLTDIYNLKFLYPFLVDEWDYIKNEKTPEKYTPKSNLKVYWICSGCGYKWSASICSRTRGVGCSMCGLSGGSKRIYYFLDKNNIDFDIEYKFDELLSDLGNPLRYDFAIFNNNKKVVYLIEYDDLQHEKFIPYFHKTIENFNLAQKYDQMKSDYAKDNNIPLLRIKAEDFKNIEQILIKELNL